MIRLAIVVEGETEESFVRGLDVKANNPPVGGLLVRKLLPFTLLYLLLMLYNETQYRPSTTLSPYVT